VAASWDDGWDPAGVRLVVATPQPTAPTMTTPAKASKTRLALTGLLMLRSDPLSRVPDLRLWQLLGVTSVPDGRLFVVFLNPMYPPT
jgi:hypothetical protein